MRTLFSVIYIATGLYIGSNIVPNEIGEKAIATNTPIFVPADRSPIKLDINLKTDQVRLEGDGDAEVQITREDKPVEIRTEYITIVKEKPIEVPIIVENMSKEDRLLNKIAPLTVPSLQMELAKVPEKITLARN